MKIGVWIILALLISNVWICAFKLQKVTAVGAPHADFFWSPTSPEQDEVITFDGSPSTPDGGTIDFWKWTFGDGNVTYVVVPTIAHAYASCGVYNVTLMVMDTENQTSTRSRILSVTTSRSTMIVAYSRSPPTLDPARCGNVYDFEPILNVYERLIFFDKEKTNPIAGCLATSWEISQDGLTYTFTIRQGVKFHNVNYTFMLTTEDVEYSLERFLVIEGAPAVTWAFYEAFFDVFGSRDAEGSFIITGQQIDNAITRTNTTVTLHLAKPYPPLLQMLSQPWASIACKYWCIAIGDWPGTWNNWTLYNRPSKTAIENQNAEPPGPHENAMCGTGPFMLDYYQTGIELSMIKFDSYRDGWPAPDAKSYLQRIMIETISDWDLRKSMFLQGQLDQIEVPLESVDEVVGQPGISYIYPLETLSCEALFFTFNISTSSCYMGVPGGLPQGTLNQSGIPPDFFSDADVRKGFAYAFNYTKLIQEELRGEVTQPATPIVPGTPYYNPAQEKYNFNLDAAMDCFSRAWYGELMDHGFNFTICYNEANLIRKKACEIIKANVESLSTTFHIQIQPLPGINYSVLERNHELPMFAVGWLADYEDPHDFAYGFMYSGGALAQWQTYSNATIDMLVREGIGTTNETSRRLAYYGLQEIYHEDCPSFPLYQPIQRRFEWDWVQGWYYNPLFLMANYYYPQWKEIVPSPTKYSWPMFHHDLGNTGYTESPAPNTNKTLWNYTTGGGVFSSPAIVDGRVYIGSDDHNVYCLDALTGAKIWNYTTGDFIESSPTVVDGRVYIGSSDHNVYCLNAFSGALIWNYATGSAVYGPPAVAYGRVYVGSVDRNVYCLNSLTGALLWNYTTGSMLGSMPAVVDDKIYVGSFDHRVYCLHAFAGSQIWNYTTGNKVLSSPAVSDGKVYLGSVDHNVYCLNALTGEQIWVYATGNNVTSSPAVAYGKVYVGSLDNKTYCLNALTGERIWSYTAGGYVGSPCVADGKVYVVSYDGRIYCLDSLTGAFIWSYMTGGGLDVPPAVADGIVFVGSGGLPGKLYAFGNVVRSEDYKTIQEAINAAPTGATVIIAPGIYNESLVVNKTLTIIGLPGSAPIFSGGGSGIAVRLLHEASGSIIAGIVITNWDQGILIIDSSGCKIYDNIMSYINLNGITVQGTNAANNQIYSNIFQEKCGIAINLTASSTSNTIYKNIISLNDVGLNLESNGNTIYANIIAENKIGINLTTSNGNVIYHNNFFDNGAQIVISTSTGNTWDDGYPSGGNYWSSRTSEDKYGGPYQNETGSDTIADTCYTIATNNVDHYPLVQPFNLHDIGISNIITSKTIVGQGFSLHLYLRTLNYGIFDEAITVAIYAKTTIIATQRITVTKRNSTAITFAWNTTGFAKGNYTIKAMANIISEDADTSDNTLIDGWVFVAMVGDITGSPEGYPDGMCDMKDIRFVAKRFGIDPSNTILWNPNADIVEDNFIDMKDIRAVAKHFGEVDP